MNVRIQSFDARIARGNGVETAHLGGTVDTERLDADGDAESVG